MKRLHIIRMVQILIGVWVLAVVLALVMGSTLLRADLNEVRSMLLTMLFSGSASVLIAYLIYRLGVVNWFRSLRYTMIVLTGLTIGLVFLNVWVLAQEMFLDYRDLNYTSVMLLFAVGAALGYGYFFAYALNERIMYMVNGAQQLAGGDLSARVPVQGKDELAELATAFNMMAARLEESAEQKARLEQARRDLIAWASHDLRTPLASLSLVVDAMVDGMADDEATRQRYLHTARLEIANLHTLITDLFELSQLDSGHLPLHIERTCLTDLLSDSVSAMRAMAERRGVTLTGRVDEGINEVDIDPEKIQRVLYNLIGNAIRHTPEGGTVALLARRHNGAIQVAVRDSGEGIPPEDLPHVFDRFYRGDGARTRDADGQRGAGLGLAIARGLIEAHSGKIDVRSQPGKGTIFTFTLPA